MNMSLIEMKQKQIIHSFYDCPTFLYNTFRLQYQNWINNNFNLQSIVLHSSFLNDFLKLLFDVSVWVLSCIL